MPDKQLTPIQEAIKAFEYEYEGLPPNDQHWSIGYLKSLLIKERKFYENVYREGTNAGAHYNSLIANEDWDAVNEFDNRDNFGELYKQYEDGEV